MYDDQVVKLDAVHGRTSRCRRPTWLQARSGRWKMPDGSGGRADGSIGLGTSGRVAIAIRLGGKAIVQRPLNVRRLEAAANRPAVLDVQGGREEPQDLKPVHPCQLLHSGTVYEDRALGR